MLNRVVREAGQNDQQGASRVVPGSEPFPGFRDKVREQVSP